MKCATCKKEVEEVYMKLRTIKCFFILRWFGFDTELFFQCEECRGIKWE